MRRARPRDLASMLVLAALSAPACALNWNQLDPRVADARSDVSRDATIEGGLDVAIAGIAVDNPGDTSGDGLDAAPADSGVDGGICPGGFTV